MASEDPSTEGKDVQVAADWLPLLSVACIHFHYIHSVHMSWEKHVRDDSQRAVATPMMTFRSSGIAFNAELVRQAHAQRATRATLYFDAKSKRVGVKFHKNTTDSDAYAITSDGGRAGEASGRWVQVTRIYERHSWLAEVLTRPARERRLPAQHDTEAGLWFACL